VNLASCYSWDSEADVGKLPGCRAVLAIVRDTHDMLRENGVACSDLLDHADRGRRVVVVGVAVVRVALVRRPHLGYRLQHHVVDQRRVFT
jgi:hypothetical protein